MPFRYRDIRNRFRLIPFGKFSPSGRGAEAHNQVFVGRARERVAMIEMMLHQERFGAYLVAGRRGSGKTSFVQHVLRAYEREPFLRLIRPWRN